MDSELYWLIGLGVGIIVGIIAIFVINHFLKKTPIVLNVFFMIFFVVGCVLYGCALTLNDEIIFFCCRVRFVWLCSYT